MVNRAHISMCLALLSGCLRKVPSGSASCNGKENTNATCNWDRNWNWKTQSKSSRQSLRVFCGVEKVFTLDQGTIIVKCFCCWPSLLFSYQTGQCWAHYSLTHQKQKKKKQKEENSSSLARCHLTTHKNLRTKFSAIKIAINWNVRLWVCPKNQKKKKKQERGTLPSLCGLNRLSWGSASHSVSPFGPSFSQPVHSRFISFSANGKYIVHWEKLSASKYVVIKLSENGLFHFLKHVCINKYIFHFWFR